MFIQIPPDQLVVNVKYKIKLDETEFVGYYKRTTQFLEFIYQEKPFVILLYRPIYRFVSDNPQWKMEQRAVNIILQRLIGDDCFTWKN